jgi:ribosome-binding protein aMBF1 (putative translation factor)
MFALGIDDSRLCTCRRCDGKIGNDDEKAQNQKTNSAESHMEGQRRWLESTGHRVPFSPVSGG